MSSQRVSHVIVGMGEIGSAFYDLLKPTSLVYGFDVYKAKCKGPPLASCDVLHVCIPYRDNGFIKSVLDYFMQYEPSELIIHSSVPPGTSKLINSMIPITSYSPWRGVHKRMTNDMRHYIKYYAFFTRKPSLFVEEMQKAGFNVQPWGDSPTSLELAKLLEVTYYGWLIIWAQHKKLLADKYGVDDEKLWQFTDEVHKYLGNRPRMFAGEGIGGHCVMQDKDLLNDAFLDSVFSYDLYYRRNMKKWQTGQEVFGNSKEESTKPLSSVK